MSTADNATTMYPPPAALVETAHVSGMEAYRRLCAEAEADYPGYWSRLARETLAWKTPFTQFARRERMRRSSNGSKTAR